MVGNAIVKAKAESLEKEVHRQQVVHPVNTRTIVDELIHVANFDP